MEKIDFEHLKSAKSKVPKYRFQETCLNIAEAAKVAPGVVFALWKKVGNEIYQIEAEIRQGEIKNVPAYIFWKLKKERRPG